MTEMADEGFAMAENPEAAKADALLRHPAGRFGQPGDIARARYGLLPMMQNSFPDRRLLWMEDCSGFPPCSRPCFELNLISGCRHKVKCRLSACGNKHFSCVL
ncbi:MAG: hypothetical protein Ct9H300mP28_06680 [Pseudomonadota bacterium]|nr:MAG: hypothetical protein Ct9H300mP28_06680 [Pseudomonadota bacterium]